MLILLRLNLLDSGDYTSTISSAAVAGGCIGGVIIAMAVSFYLYKKKADKPKSPAIHMHDEKEGGDFIPFTVDTMVATPQAEQDKKCDFTAIYPPTD